MGITRKHDRPGSRWRWLSALLLVLAGLSPAAAGDRALIDFIGYSHDLRYLAFEEYGVSDGIGTAYSSVYIVDLTTEAFAAGSPFRTEVDENLQQPLGEMRAKTHEAAKAALAGLAIDTPVEIEALSGDGVIGPADTLRFGLPTYGEPGATEGDYTLSLKTFELASETCKEKVAQPIQGFALSLSGDGPARELHRDGTLPEWRGCPVGYRLYAVVTPHETGDLSAAAAIVSSYPFDFEGSSRRFVAVPLAAKE